LDLSKQVELQYVDLVLSRTPFNEPLSHCSVDWFTTPSPQ